MDMQLPNGRLITQSPEWVDRYLNHKTNPIIPFIPFRILRFIENRFDTFSHPCTLCSVEELLDCVYLLLDTENVGKKAVVIGCGPEPHVLMALRQKGFEVIGIEPIADAVKKANEYLYSKNLVIRGTAEKIPIENATQSLVLMEGVLEHVDSVTMSLAEAYRVLRPGGILFIRTTNRMRFSLTGINWEFNTRFYNWFPRVVKESYVFSQLHYRPDLANYSPRPAVHWFSFPDLCERGRDAGFARFYSPYDLLYITKRKTIPDASFRFRHWCRRQPWIRAIIISQMVGDIFMYKRNDN